MKLSIIGYAGLLLSQECGQTLAIIRFCANSNYRAKYILSKGDSVNCF